MRQFPALSHPAAWALVAVICGAGQAAAQPNHAGSLAGDAALQARSLQQESQPYTFKSGDFKLLVSPSIALDWNDNINLSRDHALDDFIFTPQVLIAASYPLTRRNLLRFSVGVGYDQYFKHEEYSGLRLHSGSELAFDFYVKDFWINLHDQFQYTQDTAGQPAVADTGRYGGLVNTAGLSTTWDLQDVILTLGYDHINSVASSSQFDYTDRATEQVAARAGFQINPALMAGLEGSVSFTRYEQPLLNNNAGYNGGLYAEWNPGAYFEVKPRFGYTFYQFEQTSRSNAIPAVDQSAWYADLTLSHAPRQALSYSISAGHELRLGIQSDSVEDWYVRPSLQWRPTDQLTINGYFSYENGRQKVFQGSLGNSNENYDWEGIGLGVAHPLTQRFILGLNYRLTLRSSDIASREYDQNLLMLSLLYQPK